MKPTINSDIIHTCIIGPDKKHKFQNFETPEEGIDPLDIVSKMFGATISINTNGLGEPQIFDKIIDGRKENIIVFTFKEFFGIMSTIPLDSPHIELSKLLEKFK